MNTFLKNFRTREMYYTHVSMGQFKSKYCLSRDNIDDFFNTYNPNSDTISIAEKPQKYTPVIVDIDIKRKYNENLTERTNKHIFDIVNAYQKVLLEIVDNLKQQELTCIFLDKPKYEVTQNNQRYIKNGFHLHFPYIFLDNDTQKIHLIPRVKKIIKQKETFKDLGFEDSSKLIDDVTSNAWLVYGAVKQEGMDSYKISKIFDHKCNEISLEQGLQDYPLVNNKEKNISLKSEQDIIKNLPRILSILPINKNQSVIKDAKIDIENLNEIQYKEKRKQTRTKEYKDKPIEKLLSDAKQLIKLLSYERSEDRQDWLKIGWILYNISQGSDEGFEIWNEFSKRCGEKYNEYVCQYTWDKMTEGDLTIATLHYFAKQDNKKAYLKFMRESNKDILYNSLNGSHYDFAEVFQNIYGYNNVKITSQKNLSCFIWNEKTKLWVEETKETLSKCVSDIVFPIYTKLGKDILNQLRNCTDSADQAMYNARLKQVHKMLGNLKSTPYVNNIARAISGYAIDKDFETKVINRTPHELPIKNGKVINLKNLEVRDRTFNDYWSFECNVEYLGEKANLSCVEKFFNDISCNSKNLVDYHRRLWGYMLTGEISDRSLHIFWGNGCNGKSSIVNIFSNITGDFTTALNEDVMLKKTSRGANPEMMPLLTARCGSLPESDKKEEINSKRIKTITGDDVITARHLFGHAISFKTQCKPIWATNHKPKINVDDQAILDRLKLIPFLARFEKNQENTNYIKNLQENKLDEFFTWFCTGAYDWYNGQELIPCKEMTDQMNIYISENDIVAEFLEDTYELITKQEYAKLPKLEKSNWVQNRVYVYGEFIGWVNENNRKDEALNKKEFYAQLDKKVCNIKTNKITKGIIAKKKENIDFSDNEIDNQEDCNLPPL